MSSRRFSFARAFRYTVPWLLVFVAVTATAVQWQVLSGNWTDPASWVGNIAPNAGDPLDFPDLAPGNIAFIMSNNDFPAGTSFGPITISSTDGFFADQWSFTGNQIELDGDLSSAGSGRDHSWNIPLKITTPVTMTFSGGVGGDIDSRAR